MKKKTAFLSLVLAGALACSFLFAGCSRPIAKAFRDYKSPYVYQTATALSGLEGYKLETDDSNEGERIAQKELAYFTKTTTVDEVTTTTHLIYDIVNDRQIFLEENSDASVEYTFNLRLLDDKFIVIKENDDIDPPSYEVRVFDKTGKLLLAETDDEEIDVSGYHQTSNVELIKIGSKYYNMNDKGFSKPAFDYAFKTLPEGELVNHYSGKDYTFSQEDMIVTYDANLELKYIYEIPSYAEDVTSPMFFENGNYIIQYVYPAVDQFAGDFDFVENGDKYLLETKLINPSSKSVKSVSCKYFLSGIAITPSAAKESDFYLDSDALVIAYGKIEKNRPLDTLIYLTATDGGTFKEFLPFGNQYYGIPVEIANGNYLMTNKAGQTLMLSPKGEIVSEIGDGYKGCSKDYIVIDDKVFDNKLNSVEIVTKEYSVEKIYEDFIVLVRAEYDEVLGQDVDVYYVLKNGEITKLGFAKDVELYDGYIRVLVGEEYTYYNSKLQELFKSQLKYSLIYADGALKIGLMAAEVVNEDLTTTTSYYLVKA